jgi:hypothetical protein
MVSKFGSLAVFSCGNSKFPSVLVPDDAKDEEYAEYGKPEAPFGKSCT